jgi:hypothetical protein
MSPGVGSGVGVGMSPGVWKFGSAGEKPDKSQTKARQKPDKSLAESQEICHVFFMA